MQEQNSEAGRFCGHKKHLIFGVFKIVLIICLAGFLILEARNSWKEYDYIGKSAQTTNLISVDGEGKVFAVPDIAEIQVGLTTEAKTVATAQKENTEKMNAVTKAIKEKGVAEKDIKTSNYNIYPKYDWQNGKNNIIGYTISQNLDIKIRDTKQVSDIVTVAGEKGANQVGGLNFKVDNEDGLKDQAREQAIKSAQEKAKTLANQLGVKLGKVVSFTESGGEAPRSLYFGLDSGMGGSAEKSVAPEIQTGENEIQVNVTIVYEIL